MVIFDLGMTRERSVNLNFIGRNMNIFPDFLFHPDIFQSTHNEYEMLHQQRSFIPPKVLSLHHFFVSLISYIP